MNLFFVEIGPPYAFDLAKEMENNGLRLTHATSSMTEAEFRGLWADGHTEFLYAADFYSSKNIYQKHSKHLAKLNAEIREFFEEIAFDFFVLTDRANYTPRTFRDRKRLFYDLIRFWVGYLQNQDIDVVYFPCTPHAPWELVLMHACKYLGIPFTYLSHTAINNRSLFRDDYTYLEKVPEGYLEGKSQEEIRADTNTDLLADFDEESIVTNVVKLENDQFQKQAGVNADAQNYARFMAAETQRSLKSKILGPLKAALAPVIKTMINKTEFRFPFAMDDDTSELQWKKAVKAHKREAERLKAFYDAHTSELDLDAPYIYFPLHLQPELTSQPEAGFFEDQLLALETLLQALPKGWKIYLKENPRQFDAGINTVSALHYRDTEDLKRFIAHEDVLIVPQNVPSEKLIAHARVTVTLSGTAGWESLNLGKPCIVFSPPWYSPCPSCFIVKTPEDVCAALAKIEKKTAEDVEADILRYLHFYQDRLIIATLHAPSDVSYNSRSYEELLASQAKYLAQYFKDKKVSNRQKRKAV